MELPKMYLFILNFFFVIRCVKSWAENYTFEKFHEDYDFSNQSFTKAETTWNITKYGSVNNHEITVVAQLVTRQFEEVFQFKIKYRRTSSGDITGDIKRNFTLCKWNTTAKAFSLVTSTTSIAKRAKDSPTQQALVQFVGATIYPDRIEFYHDLVKEKKKTTLWAPISAVTRTYAEYLNQLAQNDSHLIIIGNGSALQAVIGVQNNETDNIEAIQIKNITKEKEESVFKLRNQEIVKAIRIESLNGIDPGQPILDIADPSVLPPPDAGQVTQPKQGEAKGGGAVKSNARMLLASKFKLLTILIILWVTLEK